MTEKAGLGHDLLVTMSTAVTSKRKPAMVFHPSEYVAEMLEDRGQTTEVLRCKHWGEDEIEAFMARELSMDNWLAMHLSRLWGTSIEMWMNLQAPWDDWPDRRS